MASATKLDLDMINRSELSRKTGVPLTTISRILGRKREPSVRMARRLAEGLGIHVGEFLDLLAEDGEAASPS